MYTIDSVDHISIAAVYVSVQNPVAHTDTTAKRC